ncbi:hypothetical protein [Streptomyces sp. CB02261]|uniref:hypothetical protein n=1 Tax=Streptomyces sp. CB02261 TaxID=1703940 RepID=UPI003083C9BA
MTSDPGSPVAVVAEGDGAFPSSVGVPSPVGVVVAVGAAVVDAFVGVAVPEPPPAPAA